MSTDDEPATDDVGRARLDDAPETGGVDWEGVGRKLLAERLTGRSLAVSTAFGEASETVRDGEPTPEDVEELYAAVEEARYAVDALAEATPGTGPRRQTFEYLDAEGRRELVERMEEAER